MTITSHELANQLLEGEDLPVNASIDLSTSEVDAERRIFTNECFGVNDTQAGFEIVILFAAAPRDNSGRKI